MDDETIDTPGPGGRPTKYDPAYTPEAEDLCMLGYTNDMLAEHFGVAVSTIHEWRRLNPEFSDAIKKGKTVADVKVARCLFGRATGNSDGESVDTTAAIFWLKNRQPQIWRDRQHVDQTVTQVVAPESFDSVEDAAKAYSEFTKGGT